VQLQGKSTLKPTINTDLPTVLSHVSFDGCDGWSTVGSGRTRRIQSLRPVAIKNSR
jgi:hypothetical protein